MPPVTTSPKTQPIETTFNTGIFAIAFQTAPVLDLQTKR
jgi:hypothetical protein